MKLYNVLGKNKSFSFLQKRKGVFLLLINVELYVCLYCRAQEAAMAKRPKPSSQNYFGSEQTPVSNKVNGNLHSGLDPTSDGSLVWD